MASRISSPLMVIVSVSVPDSPASSQPGNSSLGVTLSLSPGTREFKSGEYGEPYARPGLIEVTS